MKKVAYTVTTALVVLGYAFAGAMYLSGAPKILESFSHLGYPATFVTLLGVWKLLGATAVVAPRLPRLKEWAYAGMFFNLTAAVYSHLKVGDVGELVPPLVLLAFVMTSWALRPASRRLPAVERAERTESSATGELRVAA